MSTFSSTPSLTPSRSSSPEPPVQPDHFYGAESAHSPRSPDSDGKTWLDPEDDPLAHRGIPVFKPTMEEFEDFEAYMSRVECWGARSGIVKIIPPKEWTDALPPLTDQLRPVKIRTPIEQHMVGRGGLFRQQNLERRKIFSVREWVELCSKDEFRAPGVDEVGLHARGANVKPRARREQQKKSDTVKTESAEPEPNGEIHIKDEPFDEDHDMRTVEDTEVAQAILATSALAGGSGPSTPVSAAAPEHDGPDGPAENESGSAQPDDVKPKLKARRSGPSRQAREASLADRAARDAEFLKTFDPHSDWLPPNTAPTDYTPEFCQKLERQYWRNCGLGKPAWYGADTQGSLYTDATKAWNVAHLQSALTRLLPSSDEGLPGVNTPYLYFGMWRATFAWHVEDMDLFSINYIHFGAPKFWYSVPQGRAGALEQTMKGYFPKDTSECPQFLRHKSFLASPTLLAQSSCKPNTLVQHAGEFVITFPRGYHAGFNLGINCAESVNFALDSWIDLGKKAKACECIADSVRIDVNQLLMERELERLNPPTPAKPKRSHKAGGNATHSHPSNPRKRKSDEHENAPQVKKVRAKVPSSSAQPSSKPKITLTLKLGPRPPESEPFPCCLCVSMSKVGLLRVLDPPISRKDAVEATGNPSYWMAHEECANVVPETWIDDVEDVARGKERVIFGVDGIVKDRWNLKCSACSKNRHKAHGAPIQCTKGKCPKAFHVSCARDGGASGIVFTVLREVEKEVVLLDPGSSGSANPSTRPQAGGGDDAMNVDAATIATDEESNVLKVIKKLEVQVLCTQHNPDIAAAKKASKQDKIRSDLLALPPMSRIKIRVSAGVFEVSLLGVIESTKSVEVLWDRGVKREFKWGSVVFGSTDGPVLQKPSEMAPDSQPTPTSLPVVTYPSIAAATSNLASGSQGQSRPTTAQSSATSTPAPPVQYLYPSRIGAYEYGAWQYQDQGKQVQQVHYAQPYGYTGYYRTGPAMTGSSPHYNAYNYNHQYMNAQQLSWQQPYQGPGGANLHDYYRSGHLMPPYYPYTQPTSQLANTNSSSTATTPVTPQTDGIPITPQTDGSSTQALSLPPQQDLAALASLKPPEIAELLRLNPDLRDVVWAAAERQSQKEATVSA